MTAPVVVSGCDPDQRGAWVLGVLGADRSLEVLAVVPVALPRAAQVRGRVLRLRAWSDEVRAALDAHGMPADVRCAVEGAWGGPAGRVSGMLAGVLAVAGLDIREASPNRGARWMDEHDRDGGRIRMPGVPAGQRAAQEAQATCARWVRGLPYATATAIPAGVAQAACLARWAGLAGAGRWKA